uniref:Outer membrane protein n=1 Tax=Klebsiella pneumoniae TaxID=573 RepID=Q1G0V7_KLEPN|nr:unknown [Klebsiella pneumoniae]
MKSIAAKMVAVTIALGASSAACAAVNLHGEAGAEFTNLSASFGAGGTGYDVSVLSGPIATTTGDSAGTGNGL